MGTRHLIAVQKDNEYKVAQYGQWDGYLDGQGRDILEFISIPENLQRLKKALSKVRFIDDKKDKKFLDSYNKNAPSWSNEPDNRTEEQKRWFNLYMTRDLGAKILKNIVESEDKEIILRNSISFTGDSLFCEYAYVIDFDKNTFEIYIGFNKTTISKDERFFGMEKEEKSDGYSPVSLWKSYPLDNLPTVQDLLKLAKEEEDEE